MALQSWQQITANHHQSTRKHHQNSNINQTPGTS